MELDNQMQDYLTSIADPLEYGMEMPVFCLEFASHPGQKIYVRTPREVAEQLEVMSEDERYFGETEGFGLTVTLAMIHVSEYERLEEFEP